MELIHERLREELELHDLSAAEAARIIGESSSQGLRDVLNGRKRLSAELLAALTANAHIDAIYVLTGQRTPVVPVSEASLSKRQVALLDNYENTDEAGKKIIEATAAEAAQQIKPMKKSG